MRVVLFTGKGGVGKTTAAAATALHAARQGRKTVVVSTDRAHSLGDALDTALTDVPSEIEPGLFGVQIDTQAGFERSWRDIQRWLVDALTSQGIDPIESEELTVLPGAEEVLALLAVRDLIHSGDFDLVVLDCAPTAETLRLLALPEAFRWYVERLWPIERRIARTLRPLIAKATSLPLPSEQVFDALEQLHAELASVHAVLTDPLVTSVRLVLTPEAVVVAEARRTLTSLSLYGYRVDEVLANRVFPADGPAGRLGRQQWVELRRPCILAEASTQVSPRCPSAGRPYAGAEPVGATALGRLGGAGLCRRRPGARPRSPRPAQPPMAVEKTVDGYALVHQPCRSPSAAPSTSPRRGDDLAVTVGGQRRLLSLPSVLRRCIVRRRRTARRVASPCASCRTPICGCGCERRSRRLHMSTPSPMVEEALKLAAAVTDWAKHARTGGFRARRRDAVVPRRWLPAVHRSARSARHWLSMQGCSARGL